MRKMMTGVATCALILTGCANNEVLDGTVVDNQTGAIKFGVSTPVTRASDLFENSSFITDGRAFNIVGLSSVDVTSGDQGTIDAGDPYLGTLAAPKVLTYSAASTEWAYGTATFWPTSNLDFFSWYFGTGAGTANLGTPTTESTYDHSISFPTAYVPSATVADQLDILVGAGEYAKPAVNVNSTIQLKHATTQVVFKSVLAEGSELQVKIEEVAMMNVAKEGALKVAATAGTSKTAEPVITWTSSSDNEADRASYSVTGLTATLGGGTNDIELTNNATQKAKAMLLIPQAFDAWNPNAEIDKTTGALKTPAKGAYIRVKCKINSKTDGSGLWLHGSSAAAANLFIPVSSIANEYGQWVFNRRITYVITFGDGGSGSGGGGWTGDPDVPVLTPIKLDVEVNNWDEQTVVLQSVNLKSDKVITVASIKEQTALFDMEAANNPAKKYVAEFTFTSVAELAAAVVINTDGLVTNAAKLKEGTVVKYTFPGIATLAKTISVTPPSGWEASTDGLTWADTQKSLDGQGATPAKTLYLKKITPAP